MNTYDSIKELPSDLKFGLVIGNFDGVHRGHRNLLKEVKDLCEERGVEPVVMTFVPHPMTILRNESSFLINSYGERRELLKREGINHLVEISFTRDFSTLSPEQFLENNVLANSNARLFFLGYDFAFGANKKGDHEFVKKYCKDKDIEIIVQKKFESEQGVFSSSLVRSLLKDGKTIEASKVLERPYFMKGRVIKGAGRGRQIGFPTANIEVDFSRLVPALGVYATKCHFKGCCYLSITNVGINPTFTDQKVINVETNVFDFSGDLYGEEVQIDFFEKIRDEKKFSSVNDLIEQIKKDCEKRRALNA